MPPIDAIEMTKQVWAELGQWARRASLPEFEITSFKTFFENTPQAAFSQGDRLRILSQSRRLFANFYVHAPFKRQRGLLDPLPALAEIEQRVELDNSGFPDDEFHRAVRRVFVEQEDAHTFYGLPKPYADALAFLPFQIKRYFDSDGHPRFVVSKLMPSFSPAPFDLGVEIVGWSGEPFVTALSRSGRSEVGGNRDAFIANALARMTLRPLRFAERPSSSEELIEFCVPGQEEVHSILVPWGVGVGFDANVLFPSSSQSCAEERATFGYANLLLMNPSKCLYEQSESPDLSVDSTLPQVFEFQLPDGLAREGFLPSDHLNVPNASETRIGYIRIKTFQLPQAAGPVESILAGEFARILRLMSESAPDGLILDIRGNMGGSIRAAEAMLQMISPTPITPARFHWRFTGAVQRALADLRRLRERFADLTDEERDMLTALATDYGDWLDDADPEAGEEDRLTSGKPVTAEDAANEVGQIYQGAVVLLVDAFTYSAGDIFAGGFQDHAIGPILGITVTTGGGGAAKWNYPEFSPTLSKASGVPIEPLPGGVTMSMAVLRSSRVHGFDGQFIEDVGVRADEVHRPTRDDILSNNRDLLLRARALLLENRKSCRLAITATERDDRELRFRVTGEGYASLQYFLNGKQVLPAISPDGLCHVPLSPGRTMRLAVFGCDSQGRILVNSRVNL